LGHFVEFVKFLQWENSEFPEKAVDEDDVGQLSEKELILAEVLEEILVVLGDVVLRAVPNSCLALIYHCTSTKGT
jgi:hypothetical protein